jgi:hypothetical protein
MLAEPLPRHAGGASCVSGVTVFAEYPAPP